MPWTKNDAKGHTSKADTPKKQKQWTDVANSVLKSCMAEGGTEESCSAKAVTQANGVIAKLEDCLNNSYYYLTDISDIELEDKEGKKTSWIEVFRVGKWNHPKYGIIEGTTKLFGDFIKNWKDRVLGRDISLDKTHEPSDGATGWVQELKIKGDRLLALIEWTPWGIELIEQKGFKYFSPEYRDVYVDKESGKEHKNVLFGGALTNRPFLTDLAPIVLSEALENQCFKTINNDEIKENFWKALQEYADHDEDKIKSIMDVMKNHMQEAMDEIKKKEGADRMKGIIKSHMNSMMLEIMDEMSYMKSTHPVEVSKSNY